MKKLTTLALTLSVLMLFGANAYAAIGWAGNVYPNSGDNIAPTGDISVYAQVYKDLCTDGAGACADLSAQMFYQSDTMGAQVALPMVYLGEVGSNDEYTANIPQADILGATYVDVTVIFSDASDGSTFEITGDQNGTPPLLRYNITNTLPNDVDVTFSVCMSGTPTVGDVCVIGSAAEIGAWGTGVNMVNVGGELWEVTVTFPQGAAPGFEYKFKKDGCADWEGVGNRAVLLPTDGTTAVTLATDSYNNAPIACGLGSNLEEDKIVCLQVCMAGVPSAGGVCAVGSIPELDNWGVGTAMTHLGADLWQVCLTFPAGMPIPLSVEYKFKKDDCGTWESVGNRTFVVDNTSPAEQTIFNTWDDGTGVCQPVATEETSFGSVKAHFQN